MLHEHQVSLKQKVHFSDFPRVLRNLPTEITQEMASWSVEYAECVNGNQFKNIMIIKISVLLILAGSGKLCGRN